MNSACYHYVAVWVFVLGLCVGSFLNVVILRGLSGENFILARSKCPKCNTQLKWYMNIPLLSYAFLRGRCAFCKEKISIQYPIVEFLTGCAYLGSFLAFGINLKTVFVCLFLSFFIVLAATDILETVVITTHTFFLFALALIYSLAELGDVSILYSFLGGIGGFLLFEILARSGYLIVKYRAFGEGDSFLALALGAIFGFKNFLIVAALAILIQVIFAIPVLIKKEIKKKNKTLAGSYLMVFLSVIFIFSINYFDILKTEDVYLGAVLVVSFLLIICTRNIISSLKNKTPKDFEDAREKFNLMPFGPALILSGTICLFFLPQIKTIIKTFIA